MTRNLTIFLISLCLLTFIILYRMVKKKKILFKHAIMWSMLDIILIVQVFSTKYLRVIADFIGIEKISNMVFLFGFLVLLAICIGLTTIVSDQRNKINILTQEFAITNNKIRRMSDEKNKTIDKR